MGRAESPGQRCFVCPQMWSRAVGPEVLDPLNQAALPRQDQVVINSGGDLAADRVTDTDRVRAGLDLGPGEAQRGVRAQVHQPLAPIGLVHQVHQHPRHPPQVAGQRGRPLDPAHDAVLVAGPFLVEPDRVQPVFHPPAGMRIGDRDPRQVVAPRVHFGEGRPLALRHAVPVEDDTSAESLGLAIRIRDRAELVDTEVLRAADVGLDQHPMVGGEGPVVAADVFGRELHQDRDPGQVVRRLPGKHGEISLLRSHDSWKGGTARRVTEQNAGWKREVGPGFKGMRNG